MLYWLQRMQKYKIIDVLGDGAFGTVFKALNTQTNEVVAIKKMKQKYNNWQECLELRQIKSLRKLSHPNIIKLKEVLLASHELHLVFEYLDTNLFEEYSRRKNQGRPFSEAEVRNMLFQIASALAHMHKNGFFHRDLKPQNLLVSGPIVKLCDFGLAREIRSRPPFTDYVSTRWYRAPELLLRSTNYNSPVDVFAFGCIATELYSLTPLFPGNNDMDQLGRIVKILGTPDLGEWPEGYKLAKTQNYNFPMETGVSLYKLIPGASEEAIDLIECSMKYSSRKRINMFEILKHDYFKGITPLVQEPAKKKQILFQQKKVGEVLDVTKQQKKIEEFRTTKQKFRQTRKQAAMLADPLRYVEKGKPKEDDPTEDLDDIIRELQEKRKKKSARQIRPLKLPPKNTREKFYTQMEQRKEEPSKMPKHPVKTELDELLPHRYQVDNGETGSREGKNRPNLFSFGFQPASLPYLVPSLHEKHYTPLQHKHKPGLQQLSHSREADGKYSKQKSVSPMVYPFHY